MLTVSLRTHPGAVRATNEDRVLWDPDLQFFAVADGMGGHNAGEVASRLAIDTIRMFLQESANDHDGTWPFGVNPSLSFETNRLITAVKLANRRIFRDAEERVEYTGMGTTVVASLLQGARLTFVSVGDSRIYLVGEDALRQLSHDDSWVVLLSKESGLDPSAFEKHPMRHVLTSVVGVRLELEVTTHEFELEDGQTVLLCTDGLYGALSGKTMLEIIKAEGDLEKAAEGMIQAALDARATDNVTVLLARYTPDR
jgi:serine/threonine protein phosphatase PrpC